MLNYYEQLQLTFDQSRKETTMTTEQSTVIFHPMATDLFNSLTYRLDGFTFDPRWGQTLDRVKGFAVSWLRVNSVEQAMELIQLQPQFVQKRAMIGYWRDGKDTFIDLVFIIPDLDNAVLLSKTYGQKAFYDFNLNQVVYL